VGGEFGLRDRDLGLSGGRSLDSHWRDTADLGACCRWCSRPSIIRYKPLCCRRWRCGASVGDDERAPGHREAGNLSRHVLIFRLRGPGRSSAAVLERGPALRRGGCRTRYSHASRLAGQAVYYADSTDRPVARKTRSAIASASLVGSAQRTRPPRSRPDQCTQRALPRCANGWCAPRDEKPRWRSWKGGASESHPRTLEAGMTLASHCAVDH